MTIHTQLHADADAVDLKVYRAAEACAELADMLKKKGRNSDANDLFTAAIEIRKTRAAIRKHMHPDDVERTS